VPVRPRTQTLTLVALDLLSLVFAWWLYYFFRVKSGLIVYFSEPELWIPMLVICAYWIFIYFLFGLYRSWYNKSRLDEFVTIFKATTFGTALLFFLIFIDDQGVGSPVHTRLLIAVYWSIMVVCVGTGRATLHTIQRRMLEAGIGVHNAIIVGINEKSRELFAMVSEHRALGYRVVGFVNPNGGDKRIDSSHENVLGRLSDLGSILRDHQIKEVLVALESSEHDAVLRVIAACDGHDVGIKIVPDLYDIVSGQARTNQIYGFPLIDVMPELMPQWERATKRVLDICVSFLILAAGSPFLLLTALAIKLDSRGPVFYVQERVGREGKVFRMIKFRSMEHNAEAASGPIWARRKDPRVTHVGKFLRKLRLDEIPQFINVLDGDMSLVGPRPERPFFVDKFSQEVPLYVRRLKVRPGITGWAQVKHKYDETVEDVRKKVQYDLFYIENMSIRMDLKILLHTIYVVLRGKGH